MRFELADIVATLISLTGWSMEQILNKLSYPQLLLIMDRYPAYDLQPDTENSVLIDNSSLKVLTEFGGKSEST